MIDKKWFISALGHFIQNPSYTVVDLYERKFAIEKGTSSSKT